VTDWRRGHRPLLNKTTGRAKTLSQQQRTVKTMISQAGQIIVEPTKPMKIEQTEQGIVEHESLQPVAEQDARPSSADNQAAPSSNAELWSRRLSWIIFAGMTAVILISIIYKPAEVSPSEEYDTICGFKNLTGLPCPGCGLTHSFCEIGKGRLASAVNWNWLGPALFLLMILIWCKALFVLTNQFKPAFALDRLAARVRPMRLFAIAFAVYGIGRIVYILLYNPSARTSSSISKLIKLIAG
jgi:hypothetical protein